MSENRIRGVFRLALSAAGVAWFLFAAFTSLECMVFGGYCEISTIWTYVCALALVFLPFEAFAGLLMYVLMFGIPLGLAFLGLHAGVAIFGKGGVPAIVGFIGGLLVGLGFVISDAFDKLLIPISWITGRKDD